MNQANSKFDGLLNDPDTLNMLFNRAKELPPNTIIVELGSWKGKSTLSLGTPLLGTNKKLIAVDHFRGSHSEQTMFDGIGGDEDKVYAQFLENTEPIRNNLTVYRGSFKQALSKFPDESINLIFLDGDHELAYEDITDWWPKLAPGGEMLGHDFLSWLPVREAVYRFTKENNLDFKTPVENTFSVRKPRNFYIITMVYNAERYIKNCLQSVEEQDRYGINLYHVVVDDCSTDNTRSIILNHKSDGYLFTCKIRTSNSGSPLNSFLYGIQDFDFTNNDIVSWLDGDDWLIGNNVLQHISHTYQNPLTDMAYSNHIVYHGKREDGTPITSPGVSKPLYDPTLVRYLTVSYSHFRTFRAELLRYVSPDRFHDQKTKEIWRTCGDSALFLPMLETARHIAYVNKPLYVYNRENEYNEDKKEDYFDVGNTVWVRNQPHNLNAKLEWHGNELRLPPTRRFKMDTGRICNIKCKFCYYIHDEKQINKSTEQIMQELMSGKVRGNRFCDFSGGEPTIIKDLSILLRYARSIDLIPCIITHGQNLESKLDEYWRNGLEDILFSIHGTELKHNDLTQTQDGFKKLTLSMQKCQKEGFKFRTNTVLTNPTSDLVNLASYLSNHARPYISNFINFNPYNEWSFMGEQNFQARISDIGPYLAQAIDILVNAGTMVNVRYLPMCVLKGYEKHICNIPQVMHDGYEWDYNVTPKTFKNFKNYAIWLSNQTNKITPKCESCAIKEVCGGVNKVYYRNFGDSELMPYDCSPITDPLYFRVQLPNEQLNTYFGHNFQWTKEYYEKL